nr:hypothetical protein CFP56_71875 [Quercus suber]
MCYALRLLGAAELDYDINLIDIDARFSSMWCNGSRRCLLFSPPPDQGAVAQCVRIPTILPPGTTASALHVSESIGGDVAPRSPTRLLLLLTSRDFTTSTTSRVGRTDQQVKHCASGPFAFASSSLLSIFPPYHEYPPLLRYQPPSVPRGRRTRPLAFQEVPPYANGRQKRTKAASWSESLVSHVFARLPCYLRVLHVGVILESSSVDRAGNQEKEHHYTAKRITKWPRATRTVAAAAAAAATSATVSRARLRHHEPVASRQQQAMLAREERSSVWTPWKACARPLELGMEEDDHPGLVRLPWQRRD